MWGFSVMCGEVFQEAGHRGNTQALMTAFENLQSKMFFTQRSLLQL